MSKISNKQRHQQLKEWDAYMENKYPNYRERKRKSKLKPPSPLYFKPGSDGGDFD